ncbi:hypothetical protein D3C85_890670 [compost metagenome]
MKKNAILMLLSVSLMIISCSDNDETTSTEQSNLVSKWYLDKSSFNGISNILSTCDKQGYIQFNSDETFERQYYYYNGSNCLSEGTDKGTYSYNATTNKITISFVDPNDGAQSETFNNVNISTTTFKYSGDEDRNGIDDHQMEFIK